MSADFEDIKREQVTDVNHPMRLVCSGKPYIYFDYDAVILDCNDAFTSLLKISKAELLNLDLSQFLQNTQFIDSIRKAVAEGISIFRGNFVFKMGLPEVYFEAVLFNIESKNLHKNGIICYILESKIPAREPVQTFEDVNAISGMPGMQASVSVHAGDGKVLYISPSIASLLGYSYAELKGVDPLQLVHPDDAYIVSDVIQKLGSGLEMVSSKYRMVHKSGSVVHVESTSYAISDASGSNHQIVNVTWDLSSHEKMKQALSISEQKYYHLMMNLPFGVSLISANGQLLESNAVMKEIMGFNVEAPVSELNIFNVELLKNSGISSHFINCLESKKIVNGDIPIKSSTKGLDVFLTFSFFPVLDHKGNVETVIGYVNDLTPQKKIEGEILERAEFLNLVINAIRTPFFVKDEEHRWVILNDAAVEMMGGPREALLGKSDYDLYSAEQADVFRKYDEVVFITGSSSNEEQITWLDGTVHTVMTHKQLYVEKLTGRKFIVGTILDVSDYKKIEQELRSSGIKYHEIFDNANDFIVIADLNGQITNANRTLLKYLQTDLESITKRNVKEFLSEESNESISSFQEKLLSGLLENIFELKAKGFDGKPVVYEVKASLISVEGEPTGVQCVFSDVTERRESQIELEKLNESLLELNKTKDKFFSIIAHDLRNPYSSLIGFSELLLEDLETLNTNEIRDYLKIIRNSAKNSLNLLENLLSWSRLETGRMAFDPSEVVLAKLVDEVVNVLSSLAYRKKIEISNLVDMDITLFADKNMLNTILNNLVMNAIKYTPIGGAIQIFAEVNSSEPGSDRGFVKVSVSDNGIGMEADVSAKLFTSNKPLSSPGTEKEPGTGLGLLLSREMVEKHNGHISVESSLGKGSVFSFFIPVKKSGDIS
jgi:PAS domain S-box-containing protein